MAFGFQRGDELERVAADVDVCDRLLDLRHVARHTLAATAPALVMRMRFDARRVRSVR